MNGLRNGSIAGLLRLALVPPVCRPRDGTRIAPPAPPTRRAEAPRG